MKELTKFKLLKYDSLFEEITLYDVKGFEQSTDDLYIIRLVDKRLKLLNGCYLRLRPIAYYYYSSSGTTWKVGTNYYPKSKNANTPIFFRFKIEGIYYSRETAFRNSKLKGFSRVIDDNNYFSAIPLINQLTHLDNGILTSSNFNVETTFNDESKSFWVVYHYNNDKNVTVLTKWDKFDLKISNLFDRNPPILKMAGEHHDNY